MLAAWDATLWTVTLGTCALGVVSGALGCFAMLRRQSLLGDALAHAALPGVCLAFLGASALGWDPRNPALLLAGAMATAWLGTLLIIALRRKTRLKQDAALGIVLSVFFGVGIALLTYLQKGGAGASQAGLDKILFGQAAGLVARDVRTMVLLGTAVLVVLVLLFKEFQVLTFDPSYASSLGFPTRRLEVLLTSLIVVAVVVGLQAVGVVLMAAMVVAPAAAARQWTDRLGIMVFLAALFGAAAGLVGAIASDLAPRLPTGPMVVLSATVVLIVSLFFSPRRGILWEWTRRRANRWRIRMENLLKDLWRMGERDRGRYLAVRTPAELAAIRPFAPSTLRRAEREGLLRVDAQAVRLTPEGADRAERVVRNHRLWECYLSRRLELQDDHLHRDAEEMEHALDDRILRRIDEALGHPEVDPHGRPIPRASLEAGANRAQGATA